MIRNFLKGWGWLFLAGPALYALICLLSLFSPRKLEESLQAISFEARRQSTEAQAISGDIQDDLKRIRRINQRVVIGKGKVTYYHDNFHGRTAKNGSKFSQSGYTFASNLFPMESTGFFFHGDSWTMGIKTDTGKMRGVADLPKDRFAELAPLEKGVLDIDYIIILPERMVDNE